MGKIKNDQWKQPYNFARLQGDQRGNGVKMYLKEIKPRSYQNSFEFFLYMKHKCYIHTISVVNLNNIYQFLEYLWKWERVETDK